MMDFSEARSFNDGIEFYGKDIIIIATRKDGKVNIEKSKSPRLKYSNKFVKTIICLLLTIISNLILNTFQDFKVQILLIIALFWSSVICFFFFAKGFFLALVKSYSSLITTPPHKQKRHLPSSTDATDSHSQT